MPDDESRARDRIKRRSRALMALIVGPIVLIGWAIYVLEPHDYPAGDLRNEPGFWIVFGLIVITIDVVLIVGSVRVLQEKDK